MGRNEGRGMVREDGGEVEVWIKGEKNDNVIGYLYGREEE